MRIQAALAIAMVWLVAAPAFAEQEARLAVVADPESFDPALISGNPDFWFAEDLFEGLTAYDTDGKLVPGVATLWSSPDGISWTFLLRRDARWSDGTAVTAFDFVYALRRAVDPKTASPYASALLPIRGAKDILAGHAPPDTLGVAAPNAEVLSISLEQPTPFLPALMALPVAYPVQRVAIERVGEKWTAPGSLVGNGPFTLVSWVPNSEIVLARNPAFHDAAAVKLDRVRYEIEEDRQAALKRYLAGEIDEVQLQPDDVAKARQDRPAEYMPEPLPATEHLIVNMARGPLGTDHRLREAISLAIDRDALAGKIDPRGGQPAWSYVPPGLGAYRPQEMAGRSLAPADRAARAKALLAEWRGGASDPLTIHLSTYKDDISHRIAQAVAAMLRQNLGVAVELDEPEWRVWDAQFHRGDFDLVLYDWVADYADPWTFLSNYRADAGLLNPGSYRNPSYDVLLDRSRAAPDKAAREDLLEQAERSLLADLPVIPLEFDVLPYLIAPRLEGWHANPTDMHPARYLSVKE